MQEMIARLKIMDSRGLISSDQIRSWREAQVKPAAVFLRKASGRNDIAPYNCQEFAEVKEKISHQEINQVLKKAIRKSHINLLLNAARTHRIIALEADITNVPAELLISKFIELLHSDHASSVFLHASAAHYMLHVQKDALEITEVFAPEELPSRYILELHNDTGLQSIEDDSYEIHCCASASIPHGKHIGGLRLECRNAENNTHLKLTVECASYCTDEDLFQCRMHTACELQSYLIATLSELG